MDLRTGIMSSAKALGIDPVDLATAISYETAGTFDPTKAGPTTQWGQHRGLIQFGEPQAREYGVDWNDPLGSQLGEDGAVVRYLRKTGVQPGMGLLDIYSAINAGGVGRYGASDANNGGAPGTVRDKVEQQMTGHREKAMSLFGGDYTPPPIDQMQPVNGGSNMQQGLLNAIQQKDTRSFGQRLKDGAKDGGLWDSLAMGFNTMRGPMADQGLAQTVGARMDQRKEQATRNQTAEWLAANGRQDLAEAIMGGMISGADAFKAMQPEKPEYQEINGQLVQVSGGDLGRVVGDYRTPETPEQTSAMRNYESLIALGVDGDTALERAFGGGPKVNVNVGQNGSKFAEKSDELAAGRLDGIVQAGASAGQMMGDLQQLAGLAGKMNTGKGAEIMTRLGPYAEMVGVNIEGLPEMQAFQSITSRLAPQMRPAGAGSSSDTDVRLFLDSLPNLSRSPQGNAIINETMQAVSKQKMAAAEIASRAQRGDISWQDADREIAALGNPYESFNKMRDQIGGTTTQPAAAQSSSVQPGHVEDGYRFKGGNPSDPSSWEKVQ